MLECGGQLRGGMPTCSSSQRTRPGIFAFPERVRHDEALSGVKPMVVLSTE